jgi:thioredoxin 1
MDIDIGDGDVIVDFFTETCEPCRTMNPILDEISKEFSIRVERVDVARHPDVAQMFGISCVPTVIFMRSGKVKETIRGFTSKKALISVLRRM